MHDEECEGTDAAYSSTEESLQCKNPVTFYGGYVLSGCSDGSSCCGMGHYACDAHAALVKARHQEVAERSGAGADWLERIED